MIRSKHYAVVTSRRRGTYMCPQCGILGDLHEAVRHSISNQWVDHGREQERFSESTTSRETLRGSTLQG